MLRYRRAGSQQDGPRSKIEILGRGIPENASTAVTNLKWLASDECDMLLSIKYGTQTPQQKLCVKCRFVVHALSFYADCTLNSCNRRTSRHSFDHLTSDVQSLCCAQCVLVLSQKTTWMKRAGQNTTLFVTAFCGRHTNLYHK